MRFHVVGPPHTEPTAEYVWCPQTTNAMKFCWMVRSLGHHVYLYGGGENFEAACDEYSPTAANPGRVVQAMKQRLEPEDFICLFYGKEHGAVMRAFPNHTTCEPAVGYTASCARYRVFPSYAWLHTLAGAEHGGTAQPHFFDAVIPHAVYPWELPYQPTPEDYYLFIGRAVRGKGLHLAEQVCEHLGVRLVVAGDAQPERWGEAVGRVSAEQRGALMGGALALFAPTLYVEPFGLAAVEAATCGTPAITTDWGAYPETVEQGVDGYRCRTFAELVEAAQAAPQLSRELVHERAVARYAADHVRHAYAAYFERLLSLWADGWGTLPTTGLATPTPEED